MSEAIAPRRLLPSPVLLSRRPKPRRHWLDPIEHWLTAPARPIGAALARRRLAALRDAVLAAGEPLAGLSAAALSENVLNTRDRLRREGTGGRALIDAFALIPELAARHLGLRHYPPQVMGGLALMEGRLVEMDTGEGKTLTATLAAGTAALAGTPTHVVTVNDAETMAPLYAALGLSVGVIRRGLSPDERRAAYAADITYAANSELAFDHLRDRLGLGRTTGNLRLKVDRSPTATSPAVW